MNEQPQLREYQVWDRTTRWFHWINVLVVLSLTAAGLGILYDKELGLSLEGKALLKTVHVFIGYVMVVNLTWRLIWAFIGGPHARWRAILPFRHRWFADLKSYLSAFASGRERTYVGHNPLARLAITALLLLLVTQAVSGLVLAGTDLFYPPFGGSFARHVAAPGVDPSGLGPAALVVANSPHLLDTDALAGMRSFKKPFESVHEYAFYALLFMVGLHIMGVVVTELRGGGTLISAMFTGRKTLRETPVDLLDTSALPDPASPERNAAADERACDSEVAR
jgi:Ni/Fe-hydrogenase 1 B-type cytochrome subunit